jgi:hypothetical protein
LPYSTYLDTQLNKMVFGGTAYTVPTTLYVGLSTTTPSANGTGVTEPSGGGYARVAVTNNTTNWAPAGTQPSTGQQQINNTAITFPSATASWGTVTYVVIYDAPTGGNLLAFGALTTSQTINSGDTASFAAGALTITLQ